MIRAVAMNRSFGARLPRRTYLKCAGEPLALPLRDAMAPRSRAESAAPTPRRLVCICTPLGLHTPIFFPEKAGREYELTPYLEIHNDLREDYTDISGLSHPGVESGHD